MSFARTVTYTFPYEKIEDVLKSGTDLWMRLVASHKLLAQESSGMLDTGVWVTQQPDGVLKVVQYSEWYSVEDLHAFGNDPDVRHHEGVIAESTIQPPAVDIYEVMG